MSQAGTETADLRLEHITKKFGDVVAVNDVSLNIPHGKLITLLGPSGCGKTTILRIRSWLASRSSSFRVRSRGKKRTTAQYKLKYPRPGKTMAEFSSFPGVYFLWQKLDPVFLRISPVFPPLFLSSSPGY